MAGAQSGRDGIESQRLRGGFPEVPPQDRQGGGKAVEVTFVVVRFGQREDRLVQVERFADEWVGDL